MRDTVMIDWRVPSNEWDRFRRHVESEFGGVEGYLGLEAESAMKEYASDDGYEELEKMIDGLVQSAGRRPDGAFEEKKSDLNTSQTTRVSVKVESSVKDSFRAVAKQSDNTLGVEFARAIRAYREGGRSARMVRKMERIYDDTQGILSQMNDTDSEDKLSYVDRNVIVICNRLGDEFTDDELNGEIRDVAGSSQPTIDKYRDLVIDRLDVEPHPHAPTTVWMPAEKAADLAPDGTPRVCRLPVELLDRDDRVQRIQLAVGRRAANQKSGKIRVNTKDVMDDVFDGDISKSSALDLMEEAALTDGYRLDRSRTTASLRVTLSEMAERERGLFDEIIAYRDGESEELLSETTETTVDDYTDGPSPAQTKAQADAEMDALLGAATDGGGPRPDDRSS